MLSSVNNWSLVFLGSHESHWCRPNIGLDPKQYLVVSQTLLTLYLKTCRPGQQSKYDQREMLKSSLKFDL